MKANPRAIKWRASVLLTAAVALVIEASCSGAPPPPPVPEPTSSPSEIRTRLVLYKQDNAVVRIHMDDGTIIPTAWYSLDDSTLVIEQVLRGTSYVPELNQAHLFSHSHAKALPDDVAFPLRIPLAHVVALQRWNQPASSNPTGAEVGPRLAVFAAEKVVVRIHTLDGTIIPTSHYEVNDSTVVVGNVLRGDQYFPETAEPRLYGKSSDVITLPKNVTLPLAIPMADLATVEQWQDPHKTTNGIFYGVIIVATVALVAWFVTSVEIGPSADGGGWTWR